MGKVEFVAFPVGHACTTLTSTLDHLTTTFYTIHPHVEQARVSKGTFDPAMDHKARIHDYNLFKSLLDSLTDLAHSRLLGIISNRKRLVDALPREVSRHRAHSDAAPTPSLAAR